MRSPELKLLAKKMATRNPLEDFLNTDVDESAISALVGSLETQLASPTAREPPAQSSTASGSSNHVHGGSVGSETVQAAGSTLKPAQVQISNTNGDKNSHLIGLNSVVTAANAVSAIPNVNSTHSINASTNVIHQSPVSKPQQVIVSIGSTNSGTLVVTQNNVVYTNSVTNSSGKAPGSTIYDLASIAAEQQRLTVPGSLNSKPPPQTSASLTVRAQLEQRKDEKPPAQQVVVVQPSPNNQQQQFIVKQEGGGQNVPIKQEVKFIPQTPGIQTVNMTRPVNPGSVPPASLPASTSNVITITKGMSTQPAVAVLRPPPASQQIQIVSTPRASVAVNAAQRLAPRAVPPQPVRIAPQQQPHVSSNIRAPGSVGATIQLPPGLQLPAGAMVIKNEQGQLMVIQQPQGGVQSSPASTGAVRIVRPGAPQTIQVSQSPVRPGPSTITVTRPVAVPTASTPRAPLPRPPLQQGVQHGVQRGALPRPPRPAAAPPAPGRLGYPAGSLPPGHPGLHRPHMGPPRAGPPRAGPPHMGARNHHGGMMPRPPLSPHTPLSPIGSPHTRSPLQSYPDPRQPDPRLSPGQGLPNQGLSPSRGLPPATHGLSPGAAHPGAGNGPYQQQQQQQPGSSPGGNAQQQSQGSSRYMLENVRKCKNFLSTLLKLAASQPQNTVSNVRELIQGLIDGKVEPEAFTERLQVELKSSPQPYLVPFLKKSLPLLRQSMVMSKMHIDGVRPPPPEILRGGAGSTGQAPRIATIRPGQVPKVSPAALRAPLTQQQLQELMITQRLGPRALKVPTQTKALLVKSQASSAPGVVNVLQAHKPAPAQLREKRKYESLKDDDDINDVATMGGVNLTEESRNILATNSELMAGQLRSCKDENFLASNPLAARINAIAKKHGLDETPQGVMNLISHATQERLRNIVERLATIAEHRIEIYKTDSKYETTSEVRLQLRFLEDLDRMEKKRHDETEREVLLRAAKSRSKHEDPEQLKLKEKAKAMQQAELEEVRQREANLTALAAIGPRKKKPKTDTSDTGGGTSTGQSSSQARPGAPLRPRIKQVKLRDLLFLLEQEREMAHSNILYQSYLKN